MVRSFCEGQEVRDAEGGAGMVPLEWGQDISRRRRLLFSGFAIVRKAVISRAPEGGLYGSHVVDGLGSVRE